MKKFATCYVCSVSVVTAGLVLIKNMQYVGVIEKYMFVACMLAVWYMASHPIHTEDAASDRFFKKCCNIILRIIACIAIVFMCMKMQTYFYALFYAVLIVMISGIVERVIGKVEKEKVLGEGQQ